MWGWHDSLSFPLCANILRVIGQQSVDGAYDKVMGYAAWTEHALVWPHNKEEAEQHHTPDL